MHAKSTRLYAMAMEAYAERKLAAASPDAPSVRSAPASAGRGGAGNSGSTLVASLSFAIMSSGSAGCGRAEYGGSLVGGSLFSMELTDATHVLVAPQVERELGSNTAVLASAGSFSGGFSYKTDNTAANITPFLRPRNQLRTLLAARKNSLHSPFPLKCSHLRSLLLGASPLRSGHIGSRTVLRHGNVQKTLDGYQPVKIQARPFQSHAPCEEFAAI
jgi:hypothetical protein